MTEEMSRAKAKVLAAYPGAFGWQDGDSGSTFISLPHIGEGDETEESAWIDAASRLPAEPKSEPVELVTNCNQLPKEAEGGAMKKQRRRAMEDVSTVYRGAEGGGVEQPLCECGHKESQHWPLFESKYLGKFSRCSELGCDCAVYEPKEAAPEAAGTEQPKPSVRVMPYAVRVTSEFAHRIEQSLGATDWSWPAKTQICEEIIAEYLKVAEPATEGAPETNPKYAGDDLCAQDLHFFMNGKCTACHMPEVKAEGAEKATCFLENDPNVCMCEDFADTKCKVCFPKHDLETKALDKENYNELRKLANIIENADRTNRRFRGDEFELRQYKVESRPAVIIRLLSEFDALESCNAELAKERKRLEVQLAGCGVAATGWAVGEQRAAYGDYGWSPAYEDILKLRERSWRCYHCDFFTLDEKAAAAHFGDRDDAEEFKPLCKWMERTPVAEHAFVLQQTVMKVNEAQEEASKAIDRAEKAEREVERLTAELKEDRTKLLKPHLDQSLSHQFHIMDLKKQVEDLQRTVNAQAGGAAQGLLAHAKQICKQSLAVFDISRLQGELEFSISSALRKIGESVVAGLMDVKLEGFHPGVSSDPKDSRAHVKVQLRISAPTRKDVSSALEWPAGIPVESLYNSIQPHSAPPREPMKRFEPCDDCVDGRCDMNCGPAIPKKEME